MSFLSELVPGAARRDAENDEVIEVPEDEYGAKDYRTQMELKPDHASRPLWVVSRKSDVLYFIIQQ